MRKNDVVCRYAGSFFLLLTGTDTEAAKAAVHRLAESWKKDGDHEGIVCDLDVEQIG